MRAAGPSPVSASSTLDTSSFMAGDTLSRSASSWLDSGSAVGSSNVGGTQELASLSQDMPAATGQCTVAALHRRGGRSRRWPLLLQGRQRVLWVRACYDATGTLWGRCAKDPAPDQGAPHTIGLRQAACLGRAFAVAGGPAAGPRSKHSSLGAWRRLSLRGSYEPCKTADLSCVTCSTDSLNTWTWHKAQEIQ